MTLLQGLIAENAYRHDEFEVFQQIEEEQINKRSNQEVKTSVGIDCPNLDGLQLRAHALLIDRP